MSTLLKQETQEVRNTISQLCDKEHTGIAVKNSILAKYDRKVSFAYDSEDIKDAFKMAMTNLHTNNAIIGHSFGAQ